MNPKSLICCEPLIVPAGVLSPLLVTNPNSAIWDEPLMIPLGNCSDELMIPLPIVS